jgi:hypothetical protein
MSLMDINQHILEPGEYIYMMLFAGFDKRKENAAGAITDVIAMKGSWGAIVENFS